MMDLTEVINLTKDYSDHECRLMLQDLYSGRSVVLPTSEDHARFMIRIAQVYLDQHHQETFKALSKNYETNC